MKFYIAAGSWEEGRFECGVYEIRDTGNHPTGMGINYHSSSSISGGAQRAAVEAATSLEELAKAPGMFPHEWAKKSIKDLFLTP